MPFYKELFAFAGWPTLHEEASLLGVGSSSGLSLWFDSNLKAVSNDHDGPGMNHLGLSVKSQAEVDRMCEYLREHNIPALFETPRHRAEFSAGPDQTYYQVMFEFSGLHSVRGRVHRAEVRIFFRHLHLQRAPHSGARCRWEIFFYPVIPD